MYLQGAGNSNTPRAGVSEYTQCMLGICIHATLSQYGLYDNYYSLNHVKYC